MVFVDDLRLLLEEGGWLPSAPSLPLEPWARRASLALYVVDCDCGEFVRNSEQASREYVQCVACESWQHAACVSHLPGVDQFASHRCGACAAGFTCRSAAPAPPGHASERPRPVAAADVVADALVAGRRLRSAAARLHPTARGAAARRQAAAVAAARRAAAAVAAAAAAADGAGLRAAAAELGRLVDGGVLGGRDDADEWRAWLGRCGGRVDASPPEELRAVEASFPGWSAWEGRGAATTCDDRGGGVLRFAVGEGAPAPRGTAAPPPPEAPPGEGAAAARRRGRARAPPARIAPAREAPRARLAAAPPAAGPAVAPTAAGVLDALRAIDFPRCERRALRVGGRRAPLGLVLGAVGHRRRGASASDATLLHPRLCAALCAFARDRVPLAAFSSIALTKDTQSPLHVDALNNGASGIVGFGGFDGGELWVHGRGALDVKTPQIFDGNTPHATLPFDGERYTAIFFLHACHGALPRADGDRLAELGFRLPPRPAPFVRGAPGALEAAAAAVAADPALRGRVLFADDDGRDGGRDAEARGASRAPRAADLYYGAGRKRALAAAAPAPKRRPPAPGPPAARPPARPLLESILAAAAPAARPAPADPGSAARRARVAAALGGTAAARRAAADVDAAALDVAAPRADAVAAWIVRAAATAGRLRQSLLAGESARSTVAAAIAALDAAAARAAAAAGRLRRSLLADEPARPAGAAALAAPSTDAAAGPRPPPRREPPGPPRRPPPPRAPPPPPPPEEARAPPPPEEARAPPPPPPLPPTRGIPMGPNEARRARREAAPDVVAAFRAKLLVVVLGGVQARCRAGAVRPGDVDYVSVKLATSLAEKHHARNRGSKQFAFEARTAAKAAAYVAAFFERRGGVYERRS